MALDIVDIKNKKVGSAELTPAMGEKVNKAVLYYTVKALRNNLRHGTAAVKDRSFVNMTNKKIYKQKGTGNARHAARSANIFVGGGSAHGPRPRSYFESLNKPFKSVGYVEAVKYLLANDGLKIVSTIEFAKASTKEGAKVLKSLGLTKALVVLPKTNTKAKLSFRNLKNVKVVNEENINVLDMLSYEKVVMTADFFNTLKERHGL